MHTEFWWRDYLEVRGDERITFSFILDEWNYLIIVSYTISYAEPAGYATIVSKYFPCTLRSFLNRSMYFSSQSVVERK